ncbi:isopeptide-forming domain-containing fimbrial protein, partial [Bacillus cereus]|uniref:isopeptide-forming domain-containing fimbrial protein n=1 Tax=Bacillus cereus TaxID=1396 RepID=UPI003D164EEF
AEIKGQDVKLVLDRNQLEEVKGKEVNVQIISKIKDGTPIETVPNRASIQLNNLESINSNIVTVIPPTPVNPNIVKDVEGKEHLDVERGKDFNYNVKTKISEVKGYKTLTIADTLDKRLEVVKATVLVDGKESDLKAVVKGQNVSLILDRKQLDKLVGTEVTVQIKAHMKEDAKVETVPNKATITLNDNPSIESNEVTVIPPNPIKPNIFKDVEGKEHLEIAHGKDYNYNIKTIISDDVSEYKTLVISDILDSRLDVIKAKVLVDGKESDVKAEVKGQTVTVTLDRKQLDTLVGKEVNLQITAQIKKGTEIDLIDNKATIQLNNTDYISSNVVTVVPTKPEEPVTPIDPKPE